METEEKMEKQKLEKLRKSIEIPFQGSETELREEIYAFDQKDEKYARSLAEVGEFPVVIP